MKTGIGMTFSEHLTLRPLDLAEANAFVASFHRHNKPVLGHRFSIGIEVSGELIGVAIVGRPIARLADNGATAEITRLCVRDGFPNACSKLYRACFRAWVAMGGLKVITYTLQSEGGASLRAAGFKCVGEVNAGDWNRPNRRREWQPVYGQQKFKWELQA